MLRAVLADDAAGRRAAAPRREEVAEDEEAVEEGEAADGIEDLKERLERIEAALDVLAAQRAVKDFYTTGEVAEALGKAEFTVREWCRLGRVRAEKRPCGRGASREWKISHAELTRINNEGLLPQPRPTTRP